MSQLSKRAESILQMQKANLFACPHCHQAMVVEDDGSVFCENRHTFDVAKQGYIYLLPKAATTMYSKELFEARQLIISSGLYNTVQEKIAQAIEISNPIILDTGCGEGSHLVRICANLDGAG